MKIFLALLPLLVASGSFSSSCCTGGTSKSFVSLAELQKYEIGVSTSFRNAYGRYDAYGDLVASEKNQWMTTTIGIAARLLRDLEIFGNLPTVWRRQGNQEGIDRFTLGDAVVGFQYRLFEPTFQDDWYPSTKLHFGVKTPSGSQEVWEEGSFNPGSGNGAWEPFAGVGFEKSVGIAKLGLRFTYSKRLQKDDFKEGDLYELSETASLLLTPRWNLLVGMAQNWTTPIAISGRTVADSQTRLWNGLLSTGYAFTQLWTVSAGVEFSIPFDRFGMNQPATQAVTLTTKYAVF